MNIERLREIRDRIVAEREHFNMEYFFSNAKTGQGSNSSYHTVESPPQINEEAGEISWCGTACCVAGLAVTMYDNHLRREIEPGVFAFRGRVGDTSSTAAEMLDMDEREAYVIFAAFVDDNYTVLKEDEDGYLEATEVKVIAKVADGEGPSAEDATLMYIDYMVKMGGFYYPHEVPALREHFVFVNDETEERL